MFVQDAARAFRGLEARWGVPISRILETRLRRSEGYTREERSDER